MHEGKKCDILVSIKICAEDGDGFICRYLGISEAAPLEFEGEAALCSVLEEKTGEIG
ncbi:MAG: hypothetical protein J6I45_02145 [Clostridia bacterium]|nr:hypothetical protein [Clostridia bacterium]